MMHKVIVTFELIYEVMTNSMGKNPREYLDKLAGLELVQSRPLLNLVHREIQTNERANDILDLDATKSFIEFVNSGRGVGVTADVQAGVKNSFETSELQRLKQALDRMWEPKSDPIFKQLRPADVGTDARNYLNLMSPLGDAGAGKGIAEQHQMKQQPEPGWLIYDWERLRNFLRSAIGSPSDGPMTS